MMAAIPSGSRFEPFEIDSILKIGSSVEREQETRIDTNEAILYYRNSLRTLFFWNQHVARTRSKKYS